MPHLPCLVHHHSCEKTGAVLPIAAGSGKENENGGLRRATALLEKGLLAPTAPIQWVPPTVPYCLGVPYCYCCCPLLLPWVSPTGSNGCPLLALPLLALLALPLLAPTGYVPYWLFGAYVAQTGAGRAN